MGLRAGALILAGIAMLSALPVAAPAQSLLTGATILARAAQPVRVGPARSGPTGSASLFAGRAAGSLFAPVAKRVRPPEMEQGPGTEIASPIAGTVAERIRHLIGRAESARDGYDAVQHGAKRRPPKRPTEMTIAEIYDWIAKTPGQPHAIGRYQFIPKTLERLVREAGIGRNVRFSPEVQDLLADILLREAGIEAATSGRMHRHGFMNRLAEIWAGLPTSNGKSFYHGYAGNHATMSWASFDAEMARILPG